MDSIGEKFRRLLPTSKELEKGRDDLEIEAFRNVRDIVSRENPVLTHVIDVLELPDILTEGLVSKSFAKRVGKKYRSHVMGKDNIWFRVGVVITDREDSEAAILVDPNDRALEDSFGGQAENKRIGDYVTLKRRVAPREFVGVILLQSKRRSEIERAIRSANVSVPVYNKGGDLLWPKQMKHEEIEQRMRETGQK